MVINYAKILIRAATPQSQPIPGSSQVRNSGGYISDAGRAPKNDPVIFALALDVCGSMACSMIAGSCISAREATAAMALITAATEPEHEIIAFSATARGCESHFPCYGGMHGGVEPGITRVNISLRMRLVEVIKRIEAIPMGGTDCAPCRCCGPPAKS